MGVDFFESTYKLTFIIYHDNIYINLKSVWWIQMHSNILKKRLFNVFNCLKDLKQFENDILLQLKKNL